MDLSARRLGEFELDALIGEGAFGQVYRARQPTLDREAVVKVLRAERRDATAIDRFLREAQLASRLDHPFAAHVYAFGAEPDGVLWIAMEMVRGTPLDRVLEQGPLPAERAIPFLRRLCEVVHTAHEQGIVHRDLKPSNVMVIARAGSVLPKLIDLGVARDIGRDAAGDAAGPLGTPFYMAPEQWVAAATAGPPADVYALGAITYEVLTGNPPFDGDTVMAVAVQHARSRPPRLPAGLPEALSDVIARAMAKRARERYATAFELAAALADASGVGADAVPLPRLPERVRTAAMLAAPQPIAEAVAIVDAATNPHQAQLAVRQVAHVVAQYVAIAALACRTRAGPGRRTDSERVHDRLRALRKDTLDTDGWWQLARELVRPFAAIADAYPVPELVALFFADGAPRASAMDVLRPALGEVATTAPEHVRRVVADAVPQLGALLDEVAFVHDYQLVVAGARCEAWMGVRRPQRAAITLARAVAAGHPVLAGRDGQVVVDLWPLVQVGPPAPNAAAEVFLLDGARGQSACLVAPPHGFERQDEQIWDWFGGQLGGGEAAAGGGATEVSPYRGLATFQESDAAEFLGRDREIDALLNRLRSTPLIAVVGPSGVGKSSFVRAGVLPALRRTATIAAATLRPGPAPIAGLAAQLAGLGIAVEPAEIAASPEIVGERVRAFAAGGTEVVVIVDQLEELFTLCADPDQRAAYAAALSGLARAAEDPVRVIATVRDDFLIRVSTLPALRERVTASLHILTTPAPEALRRIVAEPARRAGYELEDAALLDEMVGDVLDRPGALALLSFTAAQLWELRDRQFRQLTRKAYQALGGVGGALGRHAEDTLAAMSAEEQRLVRVAFRHLITADGTRAVIREDDLAAALARTASDARVAASALERLIASRLLVTSEGDRGEHRVEIAHEALLSAWPRLTEWQREDADGVRFRDHLRAAAKQWDERGRPAGLLWRGDALLEYQLWRPRFPDALAAVEDAFARASEAEASRSRRFRRAAFGTLLAIMAAVSLVLWRLNARAVSAADDSRQRMLSSLVEQGRQAVLRGDRAEGLVYLAEAYSRGADSVALRFLLAAAARTTAAYDGTIPVDEPLAPGTLVVTGDGARIVAATAHELRVWDRATGAVVARYAMPVTALGVAVDRAGAQVVATPATAAGRGALLWRPGTAAPRVFADDIAGYAAEFSADGSRVLVGGTDSQVGVWDAATLRSLGEVKNPAQMIQWALSADGDRVATIGVDRELRLWGVPDLAPGPTIALSEVTGGVRFVPGGDRVVTWSMTGDCAADLWQPGEPTAPIAMAGHRQAITAAAVSADGTRIVTGSRDRTVKVWDAQTGRLVVDLEGHTALIQSVAFDAAADRVLSLSTDRTARVWDATTGAELAVLAHPDLRQAVLTADGERVVTASSTEIKVWRVHNADLLAPLADHATVVIGAAFSADEKWIATEDRRQVLWLWDRATGALVRTILDFDLGTETAATFGGSLRYQRKLPAIDPASTTLAAPVGKTVVTRSLGTGAPIATYTGHTDLVSSVRYLPDGAHLLTAGQDGVAIVWDTATAQPVQRLTGDGPLWYAEPSPDGELAITVAAGAVTLWRWATATVIHRFDGRDDFQSAAFSADGTRIAGAGGSGRILVWSVADGHQVAVIDTASRNVRAVRFVGNDLLVTTAGDGLTRVWDVGRQVELSRFAVGGIGGEGGGIERWAEVAPDRGAVAVMGSDRTARIWALDLERRPPAEVARWVACHVPLALVDQRIVPRPIPTSCRSTP